MGLQLACEVFKFFLGSEFRVKASRVSDIVSVRAAAPRLENRGRVKIGDAEVLQVRNQATGIFKAHRLMKLQAIHRYRNSGFHHPTRRCSLSATALKCSIHARAPSSPCSARARRSL